MNYNEPIKQFFGVTYDNQAYHFFIDETTNKIYCCEFGYEYVGHKIEIKPNFVFRNEYSQSVYSLSDYLRDNPSKKKPRIDIEDEKQQHTLIRAFIIEPYVYEYLKENNMIMYSHDMAVLYNLDSEHAFDRCYKQNAFKKHRKDKTKILAKQKRGIFQ